MWTNVDLYACMSAYCVTTNTMSYLTKQSKTKMQRLFITPEMHSISGASVMNIFRKMDAKYYVVTVPRWVNTPTWWMRNIVSHCRHDDVIKWKHFPRHWPFVRGIHRSSVTSPHKGQWRGAFMFSFFCVRINSWVNNGEAGDLRRHRAHYDVTVMLCIIIMAGPSWRLLILS